MSLAELLFVLLLLGGFGCGSASSVVGQDTRSGVPAIQGCPVHMPSRDLPPGFVPGATDSDWLQGDQAGPVEYRTAAFTYDGDAGPFVVVQYHRFAPLRLGLGGWTHAALVAHDHAMAGFTNINDFAASVPVYCGTSQLGDTKSNMPW